MESANTHHQHQLQDQHVVGSSSSSLATPSCYAAGSTHAWTPNTILNTSSFSACSDGGIFNSRDSWQQNNLPLSSVNISMTQDSGFHWANTAGNSTNQSAHDLHLARIKNESPDSSCSKLSEVLSSPSQEIEEIYTSYMKNEARDLLNLNAKLLSRSLPSGYQMNVFQQCSEDSNSSSLSSSGSVTMPSGGSFSQIFPTTNISNFNQMSLANSPSLDMNFQALDLFNSARFAEGFGQLSRDQLGFFKGGLSYGLEHMQQPSVRPISIPNNISSFSNGGVVEAKRSFTMLESNAPQPAPKKSRIESRASCPPFKVRKEKLGDRIAALQQLVAPFGKTDTASVLMEAFGYIKFLQNQVETLSVPYMKLSRNKTRVMQGVAAGNESEESKRDLRSRGLCLVPSSSLSYVTDGGGGVWPPPTFGGGF